MAYVFCDNCGKCVETNQKYCSSCGTKIEVNNNTNIPKVQQSINTNKKTNTKKGKITGIGPGIAFIIGIVFVCILINSSTNDYVPVSSLSSVMNEEQVQTANTIIKNCELEGGTITRNEEWDSWTEDGSIVYDITKNGIKAMMCVKDGEIVNITYLDMYLYKDGNYPDKLSENTLTRNEKNDLILKCQNSINNILKSPSTAKYPWDYNEWKMKKEKGEITIQSYVDAQNSFGATIRSQFQFIIKNGKVTSLIFDGQEYIK